MILVTKQGTVNLYSGPDHKHEQLLLFILLLLTTIYFSYKYFWNFDKPKGDDVLNVSLWVAFDSGLGSEARHVQ